MPSRAGQHFQHEDLGPVYCIAEDKFIPDDLEVHQIEHRGKTFRVYGRPSKGARAQIPVIKQHGENKYGGAVWLVTAGSLS